MQAPAHVVRFIKVPQHLSLHTNLSPPHTATVHLGRSADYVTGSGSWQAAAWLWFGWAVCVRLVLAAEFLSAPRLEAAVAVPVAGALLAAASSTCARAYQCRTAARRMSHRKC